MKLIQTTIDVDDQRTASLRLPADVDPGRYQVVVVMESHVGVGGHGRP